MKTKSIHCFALAFAAAAATASAFTLDFASLAVGTPVPNVPTPQFTFNVPGYGDVQVWGDPSTTPPTASEVAHFNGNITALKIIPGERLSIKFIDNLPYDVSIGNVGVTVGAAMPLSQDDARTFSVTFSGGSNAGLRTVSFVPEPSGLLLGSLGSLLLLRRRRA